MNKTYLSLVIACYNEGQTFEDSVLKILSVLKNLKRDWEIIFVEDKSDDRTRDSVEKLTKKIKYSRAIYHHNNQGRGKTVADGILAARGDVVGYLDVDLEVSANYIPLFIEEIDSGADLAVGRRFYESGFQSIFRVVASKAYAFIVKQLLGAPVADTECGYKFFNRKAILPVIKRTKDHGWFWDTEICLRTQEAGLVVHEIPVLFKRRKEKKSTVKLIPDTIAYLKNIFRYKLSGIRSPRV